MKEVTYNEIEDYANGLLILLKSIDGTEPNTLMQQTISTQLAFTVQLIRKKYGLVSGIWAPAEHKAVQLFEDKYNEELFK